MKNSNPTVIPRNHQVNKAIKLAEDSNYSFLNDFVATLKKPYGINQKTKFYNQSASHDEDVEFTDNAEIEETELASVSNE